MCHTRATAKTSEEWGNIAPGISSATANYRETEETQRRTNSTSFPRSVHNRSRQTETGMADETAQGESGFGSGNMVELRIKV